MIKDGSLGELLTVRFARLVRAYACIFMFDPVDLQHERALWCEEDCQGLAPIKDKS